MPLRAALAASALAAATVLPEGAPIEPRLPDPGAELVGFVATPPEWSRDVVNAVLGEGTQAQSERRTGFLSAPEHWQQVDYVDRAHNYATHGWLARRGIASEHYGFNEYQETIHLRPELAQQLLGERGLARGPLGELVIDPVESATGRAYIADPIEPRWSAVLGYDQAVSPLFGDAISQDNVGGAIWGTGPSALGSYSDASARGYAAWRAARGEPAVPSIRDYLRTRLAAQVAGLAPYAQPAPPDWRRVQASARALCADPVFAEYQVYRQAANLAAWKRLYTHLRRVAERAGRDFDVHGNLGGAPLGPDAYPISLAPLVDTVWFETSGLAQFQFQHGWWNAAGALRLELALAAGLPDRPVMFFANPQKKTADLFLHELAETSAGGGVPLANPDLLAKQAPEALPVLASLFELRDRHRAVYQARGRTRVADVALLYSVATTLFDQCVPGASNTDSPPENDFASAARALEDAHVPYDVVVLRHPELAPQAREPDLARYRVAIAPSLESLADADLARLTRFLKAGGTLAVIGKLGVRDERYRPRAANALAALRSAGRVQVLVDGASFPATTIAANAASARPLAARLTAQLVPLLPAPRVSGDLPATTWVKLWRHAGGFASAHFVSYALDYASGKARPAPVASVRLRLPGEIRVEQARWLVPGEPDRELPVQVDGDVVEVTLPALRVYGVLVLGPAGAEARASALARGDRRLARARKAGAGAAGLEARVAKVSALRAGDPTGYDAAAGALLVALSAEREQDYLDSIQRLAGRPELKDVISQATAGIVQFGQPVAAFAFGQPSDLPPWRAVGADTEYSHARGFGWLPRDDDSHATPEEKDYAGAIGQDPDALVAASIGVVYWPYLPAELPAPVSRALVSGPARTFRVDLPDGDYRVSLVAANAGWPRMNLLVSGMVTANGRPVLLDTPLDKGALVRRSFTLPVTGGALELRLGGATGFGIASLEVEKATHGEPDPLATGGVRHFTLSPRHPNPDWLALDRLEVPASEGGSEVEAAAEGIPLVDLGTLGPAQIGDVVVARAEIQRAAAGSAELRVGASSAARVYLNGELVLDLPNVKGVEADEGRARVALRAGANRLEIRLERFWERRWLFFASVL
jgi:hypothetical protein